MDSIVKYLLALSGPEIHKSPMQCQAAYASGTSIDVTGARFPIETRHILGIVVGKAGIASRAFVPWLHTFSWAAGVPGAGTLTITQGDFDASEEFQIVLYGPRAGFREPEDAGASIVENRDVIPVFEVHEEVAAGAAVNGTESFPIVMDPWDSFVFAAHLIPGAGAAPIFTITFQGESTDDATAPGLGNLTDITVAVTGGAASLTEADVDANNNLSVYSSAFGFKRIWCTRTVANKDAATAFKLESRKLKG